MILSQGIQIPLYCDVTISVCNLQNFCSKGRKNRHAGWGGFKVKPGSSLSFLYVPFTQMQPMALIQFQ